MKLERKQFKRGKIQDGRSEKKKKKNHMTERRTQSNSEGKWQTETEKKKTALQKKYFSSGKGIDDKIDIFR